MNKKLIVLAVAAAVAAPMTVMADATIYGKVRIGLEYDDNASVWDLRSYASRLGIKGSEDLGNGLSAIWQLEFGVNPVDADNNIANGDKGNITYRNTFVGLAGGWGTALVGRHDTPLKMSTGDLDLFADTAADMNDTVGFQDLRVDNAIAYVSPNMSGFSVAAAIVPAGTSTAACLSSTGATLSAGCTNPNADSLGEAWSIAAMYANGPWRASVAYEDIGDAMIAIDTNGNGVADLQSADGFAKWRLGLGMLGYNNFSLTGIYENWDLNGADSDLWQIQAGYDIGATRLKAMYGSNGGDDNLDRDTWALGVQQNLSKRTDAQLLYTEIDANSSDRSIWSVQLNHSF